MKKQKPELLLPAGNLEAFVAAVEGGANAIYLGMKQFNARGRAANFSANELASVIKFARKRNVKVYITLNTIIKNKELPLLLENLNLLRNLKPDAVIIQDWGVYYIIKNLFPEIEVHASTQMANHNSLGANFSKKKGFGRVILARELSFQELSVISSKTSMPLEIFLHGALCYSFSGICLFSSYLGGNSANRGSCMQVCRREFILPENRKSLAFNLKDNQLIDYVDKIADINIASIKIEGRLKQAEYVYKVAKAYRMAIDNIEKTQEAKKLLENDGAREKTSWFFGQDVSNSLTENNQTGIFAGKVSEIKEQGFNFTTSAKINNKSRLRINNIKTNEAYYFTPSKIDGNNIFIKTDNKNIKLDDEVYITSFEGIRFKTDLPFVKVQQNPVNKDIKNKFFRLLNSNNYQKQKLELYTRIASFKDIEKLDLKQITGIFTKINKSDFKEINQITDKCKNHNNKIYFELPKFINENSLNDYKDFLNKLSENRFNEFVISHLSQVLLLPKNAQFITNENVYVLNDLAASAIKKEGAKTFTYALENDYPNLIKGKSRDGIIPLYFYPDLFYSRMPVDIEKGKTFKMNDNKTMFTKTVIDGITIVRPENPVSLLHVRNKLETKGFSRFLIDLSNDSEQTKFNSVFKSFYKQEKIEGSTMFNFKLELK